MSKSKSLAQKGLKLIAVSDCNYFELKKRGLAADSFNDVITKLLIINKKAEDDD